MIKNEAPSDGEYLRVVSLDAMLIPGNPYTPVIILHLEGGYDLTLSNVPFEIVEAINRIKGIDSSIEGVVGDDRESIYDLMAQHEDLINIISSDLSYVVVDELNPHTQLYNAKAVFSNGATRIERKMIPSHAIFLAFLTNKPIYVKKELVLNNYYHDEL